MKKLLIISYFFPPGNFAGSYRIKGWADYFYKFGYFPIVITRHWDENSTEFTSISKKEGVIKEEFGNYTVYRLPYKGSIRDRLINRFGSKALYIGKIFSLFQVIGQNYFLRSIPYRNIYDFSRQLIKENSDINIVLTSGRPFVHFKFAYLLKKEFQKIKWIADYRDPWNSDITIDDSLDRRIQRVFEKSREFKWVKSASLITTVSPQLSEELASFLEKPVEVIYNGFEPKDYLSQDTHALDKNIFKIVYNGTLYPGQNVLPFLKVFKKIVGIFNGRIYFKLVFAGTLSNKTVEKFIKKNPGLDIEITSRISKGAIIDLQKKAQLLLMIGHEKQKGVISSKVFEYFGVGRPIFLFPTDNGILEKLIHETQTGFICKSVKEAVEKLTDIVNFFIDTNVLYFPKDSQVLKYTRENQTKILASLMKELK
jgi:hypothetical protein